MACKSRRAKKTLLRTAPQQYLRLAQQAEEAGVSLNSLVLSMLGFEVPFNQNGSRRGRRPGKSEQTSRILIRLTCEQHAQLVRIAEKSNCSVNTLVLSMLDLEIPFRQKGLPTGPKIRLSRKFIGDECRSAATGNSRY